MHLSFYNSAVVALAFAAAIAFLATSDYTVPALTIFGTAIACGGIGFLDDWFKLRHRRSLGLNARWKMALLLAITVMVFVRGVVAYAFGGLAFGFRGWGAPILTSFRSSGGTVDVSAVRAVPLWEDTILVFGLAWYACLAVGAIAFLASVLLRWTAAAMGTMFAALIAGTILPRVASTWEAQKYLFVTNLPLPDY